VWAEGELGGSQARLDAIASAALQAAAQGLDTTAVVAVARRAAAAFDDGHRQTQYAQRKASKVAVGTIALQTLFLLLLGAAVDVGFFVYSRLFAQLATHAFAILALSFAAIGVLFAVATAILRCYRSLGVEWGSVVVVTALALDVAIAAIVWPILSAKFGSNPVPQIHVTAQPSPLVHPIVHRRVVNR
jgi:hypothetical protein